MSDPIEALDFAPDAIAEAEDGDAPHPGICQLDHALFNRLGDITFRRAETDGTPMMIVPFGEREAGIPLRSLQYAFAISDDSADGRMLGLIAESLDYITCLRIGDRLPDEVVTGGASWRPAGRHRAIASNRIRLQLLAWLDPAAARDASQAGDFAERVDADPAFRAKVQAALREAATALELPDSDAVVALIARLSEEMAFIEALRERLLARVLELFTRLTAIGRGFNRQDAKRREVLTQVQRLMLTATSQFRARFDDIDAQTGEVLATLRNADSQIAFIRSNRDAIYRSLRAWEPLLTRWANTPPGDANAVWPAIDETYQFLARRHLPVSEWPNFNSLRQGGTPRKPASAMSW